ncbi:MAG TPA: NTP transferase domain-containing protein [Acidimicrobiia bacterium]|jgi:molybdopterin-guanine dinucleotide biosynthesis protein A|nr:NTP transferase domain-containing protein [Acidimicrobiia bacterium]
MPAGLLLTGGASTRLGAPKAELRRDGERLADRGGRLLGAVCETAFEVGPGASALPPVREDPPGAGPLAAVAAGAAALGARGSHGPVLVLAVDLPYVDEALLRWLADREPAGTLVPRVGGVAQSLCARYTAADLAIAARLVADGASSMRALLATIDATYADERDWGGVAEPEAFTDVDTAAAVARAQLEWPARPPG